MGLLYKSLEKVFEIIDSLYYIHLVIVSSVYTYLPTHQVVSIKYVKLFVMSTITQERGS